MHVGLIEMSSSEGSTRKNSYTRSHFPGSWNSWPQTLIICLPSALLLICTFPKGLGTLREGLRLNHCVNIAWINMWAF